MRLKDWDKHWEKPGQGMDGVGAEQGRSGVALCVSGAHVEQSSSSPPAHFPHPREDKWGLLVLIVQIYNSLTRGRASSSL